MGHLAGCRRAGEWQQGDSLGGPGAAEDRPLVGGFKATALWEGLRGFSGPPSSSSRGCSSGFRCRGHRGQHVPISQPGPCPLPCNPVPHPSPACRSPPWTAPHSPAPLPGLSGPIHCTTAAQSPHLTPQPYSPALQPNSNPTLHSQPSPASRPASHRTPSPPISPCPQLHWHLDMRLALDLEGLGCPLLLLQGIELLLPQELRARVHRQLPRVLQVGAGTPAWVHRGPQ